jgi:hypothetical protein
MSLLSEANYSTYFKPYEREAGDNDATEGYYRIVYDGQVYETSIEPERLAEYFDTDDGEKKARRFFSNHIPCNTKPPLSQSLQNELINAMDARHEAEENLDELNRLADIASKKVDERKYYSQESRKRFAEIAKKAELKAAELRASQNVQKASRVQATPKIAARAPRPAARKAAVVASVAAGGSDDDGGSDQPGEPPAAQAHHRPLVKLRYRNSQNDRIRRLTGAVGACPAGRGNR